MPPRRRNPTLSQDELPDMGFRDDPNFDGGPDVQAELADRNNFPIPFVDYMPNEIAGSPDAPRDIFGVRGPRTTAPTAPATPVRPGPSQPPPSQPGPDSGQSVDQMLQSLPQGVESRSQGTVNAPMQSSEPQSVSMSATPPASASGGAPAPARQPFASPVNLVAGGDQSPGLIGRSEGLFGGGVGMPGGRGGGPKATEQMLELLRAMGVDDDDEEM